MSIEWNYTVIIGSVFFSCFYKNMKLHKRDRSRVTRYDLPSNLCLYILIAKLRVIADRKESGNANVEAVENTSLIFDFAASYRIGSIGKNNRGAEAYKNLRLIVENCGARRGASVSDGNYIGVTLLNWLSLILYWNERARWTTAHVPTITPARLDMHTKQLYEITHRVDNDGFFLY